MLLDRIEATFEARVPLSLSHPCSWLSLHCNT